MPHKKIPSFSSVIFKISNDAGGFSFYFFAGQDNTLLDDQTVGPKPKVLLILCTTLTVEVKG
jgi:hypothetical protein